MRRDTRLAGVFDAMVISEPSSFPLQEIPHERVAIAGGISFVMPFLVTCLLPGVRRFEPAELE